MTHRTPRTKESWLAEAARLCKQHGGLYYVTRPDCFLVYRTHPEGGKGIYVGRRSTPAQLATLIHKAMKSTGAKA